MTAPTSDSNRTVYPSAIPAVAASSVVTSSAPTSSRAFRALPVSLTIACLLLFAGLGGSLFCLSRIVSYRNTRESATAVKSPSARLAKNSGRKIEERTAEATHLTMTLFLLAGVSVVCGVGGGLCVSALRAASQQQKHWQRQLADRECALEKTQAETAAVREKLSAREGDYTALMEEMRRRDRSAIRQQEEIGSRAALLSHAVASANDVVMISDAEPGQAPRVVFVNAAFSRMTGYEASEIIGYTPRLLQGEGTDRETVARIRRDLRAGRTIQAELLNYRKDGTPFWVELNIQPITDDTGHQTHWISVQRDVTERRIAAEKLEWQANHDALTCLPNRKLYQDRLSVAIAHAQASDAISGGAFLRPRPVQAD